MKRLYLFIGTLSWGARLQILVVTLILVYYAWFDFQRGQWPVTIGIIATTWLIGWLLKPVMIAHQTATYRILASFGVLLLFAFVVGPWQWWWKKVIAHYGREFVLWLDLSVSYWFISELRLQEQQAAEDMIWQDHPIDDQGDRNLIDSRRDDFGDDRGR